MLNLPRVTGWGTDTIASTMIKKNVDDRDKETERTRMIGNALLQQAKEGNLDDSGFAMLSQKFPELAGTAKQANVAAQKENASKLQNMKLQKTELGWKLFNQKIDAANKFGDETIYGDAGRELQKTAMAEAKQFADMMGIPFNMSAAMEAQDIKKEQKKFNMALLQKNITGIQQGASPEQIASVEGMLSVFASKNKGEPAIPIMEKMIATAKGRLEKEAEQKEKLAEEGRKKDAEIAKENRTQKIKMTNPKNGRTVDVPAAQQAQFEKAGWELGGRSEDKPDTVVNVGNIEATETARDTARLKVDIKKPKFKADATVAARTKMGDLNWKLASEDDKKYAIRKEVDDQIKQVYPEAVFDKIKGVVGWYDGNKLIRSWAD